MDHSACQTRTVTCPSRILACLLAVALGGAACSDGGPATAVLTSAEPTGVATSPTPVASPAPTTTFQPGPATFTVQAGTQQVAVLGAEPGTELVLMGIDGGGVAGTVDDQGSLLFRDVAPGGGYTVESATERSERFEVADPADHPDASWYASQEPLPAGGFGYLTTRDGTTLSVNVVLPGPVEAGPYPTVVEYSGYQPSDPGSAAFAQIYTALGFAYVGVNMRGTGCSGGSYRFFETVQSLDGYDVVETVAAQPWVAHGQVGMVGISYPGISQLFVAATTPPSLAAITPLSVLDDSFRATLYPGGILNTGFAVEWTQQRLDEARPLGQAWTAARIDGGDDECAANQRLRLQNPDLVAEIGDNPYYTTELGDPLAPITFIDRIEVPVFLAGAWQDEQTGGHFPRMLDRFTNAHDLFVTLVNGGHTESLSPAVFARYVEFLQLYVAREVPDLTAANQVVPVLASTIFGTDQVPTDWPNRFTGRTYESALDEFEREPSVRILLEQGAADGWPAGAPVPSSTLTFERWPVPEAIATTWALGAQGRLLDDPAAAVGESRYSADPDALPATFYTGGGSEIWRADATYDWRPIPDGTGVGFVTDPLVDDLLVVGPGSVDLWIEVDADDTDLEVTISEVRPDGTEIYVQSGWLRASQRALDDASSTDLDPAHTHLEADAAPLPAGTFTEVRVGLFPVAHVFRAGSRLRLTIDAPGSNRPIWEFATLASGETVTIGHDIDRPSRLVLPVVTTSAAAIASAPAPACGSLRGQPCRAWVPAANGG